MSQKRDKSQVPGQLFVDPGRIVDTLQRESEATIPFRQFKVLFPVHSIEAFGDIEEEHEYELLEHFIELGIAECGLTTATDLNQFLGLDDIQIVEKMISFLRTIDHIRLNEEDGTLVLLPLGKRSLEMARSYRLLKTWRTFYFDAFTQDALPGAYYDMRFLSWQEAEKLKNLFIYRLGSDYLVRHSWQHNALDAMKKLEKRENRNNYNLPHGISISEVKPRELVYLPMNIVETRHRDMPDDPAGTSYIVFTQVRGFRDDHFTDLINKDNNIKELLADTFDRHQSLQETLHEWLAEQPFASLASLQQNEQKMWRLSLQRDAFKGAKSRYAIKLNYIGSYRLASNYYFVQYWCDDPDIRYAAALDQIVTILDRLRQQRRLTTKRVERLFERVSQHLDVDSVNWVGLRDECTKHNLYNLLGELEELLIDSPLLKASEQQEALAEEQFDQTEELVEDVLFSTDLESNEAGESDEIINKDGTLESRDVSKENNISDKNLLNSEIVELLEEMVPLEIETLPPVETTNEDAVAVLADREDVEETPVSLLSLFMEQPLISSNLTRNTYGGLVTDALNYQPLERVTVSVCGRQGREDQQGILRVYDGEQQLYFEAVVELCDNQGQLSFVVAGALGTHTLYLFWKDEEQHSRIAHIAVDCTTSIKSGDPLFDNIYPRTFELMQRTRRIYHFPAGLFVGYTSAEVWPFDGVRLYDWLYSLPAYKYWEREMICGLERVLEHWEKTGMLGDQVDACGTFQRVNATPDVEYLLVLAVWESWRVTGDTQWLRRVLPQLTRLLASVQENIQIWDEQYKLVKCKNKTTGSHKQDRCSEVEGHEDYIVEISEQAGYYHAFRAMCQMYRAIDDDECAAYWAKQATSYQQRAVELLWDGQKFLYQVHLSSASHSSFHEAQQLGMGNTWALICGLANRYQAQKIIDEYRHRRQKTGDAYPWWYLQSGDRDHEQLSNTDGIACKDLLIARVGGELCLGAFCNGRASYGVELLRQYAEHLCRTGGVYSWYHRDGEPYVRSADELPYATRGLARWLHALIEGLVGLQDASAKLLHVYVAPCWAITGMPDVQASVRYSSNQCYFAYRMHIDYEATSITLDYCGSGKQATFQVLIPSGWQISTVMLNDQPISFELWPSDDGVYLSFSCMIKGAGQISIVSYGIMSLLTQK